ncbi:ATP-binding protein [Acutalibacter intestini]|uniref:ATP-binding protein n=1 Tax=Acutalibacter intestini TaxID=3093659 RepID=UPI00345F7FAD
MRDIFAFLLKTIKIYSQRNEVTLGLGLGLAVSRVLCQKHGGTIELSNQPPHGACAKASIKIEQSPLL